MFKPGWDTSKQNNETGENYAEHILSESDFGVNSGGMVTPEKNAPMDCPDNYPNLGIETSFGSNPNGEMFGMSAPDKMNLSNYIPSRESKVLDEKSFPIELPHDTREGTRGDV
jgi:hypothetical protein